jgi:hypothetical protein
VHTVIKVSKSIWRKFLSKLFRDHSSQTETHVLFGCVITLHTLSRIPNFDYGQYGGCDRSAEDAYSFAAPDPTSGFSRGQCKPDFQCGLFHLPNLCTDFDCGFFRVPGLTHRF